MHVHSLAKRTDAKREGKKGELMAIVCGQFYIAMSLKPGLSL